MAEKPLIRLTTEENLRKIQTQTFINRTSKVNKVSTDSVLSAIISGNAKVSKKALKDIQLALSQLFPSTSAGSGLDEAALHFGVGPRLLSSQSSAIVKIIATAGTLYEAGTHTFEGDSGVVFDLEEDTLVGSEGYVYAKVRSQDVGAETNIPPFDINAVNPIPIGHTAVTNEYIATGGRDVESDDVFRARIIKGANTFAEGTLAKFTQILININSNVLRVLYAGVTSEGKKRLIVLSQNGINFTQSELDAMLQEVGKYVSFGELNPTNTNLYGIELINPTYQFLDVSMRLEIFDNYDLIEVITNMQTRFSKAVDFRFWKLGVDKVEWDELLKIAKSTAGVKYVADNTFSPAVDILIDNDKFPKFRGFVVQDLQGNILLDKSGTINPIYYPNEPDVEYNVTVL